MSNPNVHQVGSLLDLDGRKVTVARDYDAVTIDGPCRFDAEGFEEFSRYLAAARFEAVPAPGTDGGP